MQLPLVSCFLVAVGLSSGCNRFGLAAAAASTQQVDADVHEGVDSSKPSIVLFLVDTLRADHLSVYGYERETSPQLESFARDGVVFDRCLAQSTWTRPATTSVLTGLYPSQHGVHHPASKLRPESATAAELLQQAGYATRAFVTNPLVKGGLERGFDEFSYYRSDEALGYVRAETVLQDVLEWVREVEQPFFAYVHLLDPHAPYDPPPPYDREFNTGYVGPVDGYEFVKPMADRVERELTVKEREHLVSLYDGEIRYVDAHFGALVDELRSAGRYADTLTVFLSDHGEEFGDHGQWQHPPSMYEEVLRVPLVCHFPNLNQELRGPREARLSSQIDVLPTILDVAGIEPPPGLPGRSLLPRDAGRGPERDTLRLAEVDQGGVYRKAVVDGPLKYVRSWSPHRAEALFDLALDPLETRNLIAEFPERGRVLAEQLDQFVERTAQGFSIVFRNGGDEEQVALLMLMTKTAPLEFVEEILPEHFRAGRDEGSLPRQLEWDSGSGTTFVTEYTMRAGPQDDDGLTFRPHAAEEQLTVAIRVGSSTAEVGRIFLGATGGHPAAVPFRLDLTDASALVSPHLTALSGERGDPYSVQVWRSSVQSRRAELGPEVERSLRALGYLMDE